MQLTSPAFQHNQPIPSEYTCDGKNASPPLEWSGVPENAKSLALIVDDPDVPKSIRSDGLWIHWLVWNIPPTTMGLVAGALPHGIVGKNTSGEHCYHGPCPPDREHRYFFKLYALNVVLDLPVNSDKAILEAAICGHVLESAELMGTYQRIQ